MGLLRLLQVRRLLEERAELDLRRRTADLRRLETEAERQRRLATEARNDALRSVPAPEATDSWVALADAEIFLWRKRRLAEAARRIGEEVAVLREHRMTRRMESQQVEALVTESQRAQKQEQIRREQQHVDDWFQSRPSSESRRLE